MNLRLNCLGIIQVRSLAKNIIGQPLFTFWWTSCGSNAFQDYFDDATKSRVKQVPKNQASSEESRVKQVPKNQESSKFQESRSRFKIQDSSKESRFKNQEKTQSR